MSGNKKPFGNVTVNALPTQGAPNNQEVALTASAETVGTVLARGGFDPEGRTILVGNKAADVETVVKKGMTITLQERPAGS